jgi:hypothetical protein
MTDTPEHENRWDHERKRQERQAQEPQEQKPNKSAPLDPRNPTGR